ncbi:MAG: hypothetical protein BWY15_02473 [Firmicutes bacterium ADurb.Bin193]|nr:MAG: hypothetical protein BWY15_02473 [Firmicutes bacterium ADurb.Bin193]
MFNLFNSYAYFILTVISFVIVILLTFHGALLSEFFLRGFQKGSLNVGKVVDDIRYLKAGKLTLKIKAQCIGKKPLEEKIQKLIEREITK